MYDNAQMLQPLDQSVLTPHITVREAYPRYANGPTRWMCQLTRYAERQQTNEGIGEIITNLSQSLMSLCFNASLSLHRAAVEDPATKIVPQL